MIQRKPPAKRLWHSGRGGVGVVDTALDAQNEQQAPKKRGRPPKFGSAMSPAEQKRRKREEKERRDLAAWLIKKFRSMQPRAARSTTKTYDGPAEMADVNLREQRARFAETVSTLPVDELKKLKQVWDDTPDSQGRLHGERSGEADRQYGQSEVESIVEQKRQSEDGRKVKPQGHSSKRDEKGWDSPDDSADTAEQSSKAVLNAFRSSEEESAKSQRFYDKMHLVARWMMKDGKCSVCGSTDGEDHVWHKYYEGVAAEARFQALHSVDPDSAWVLHHLMDSDHLNKIDELLRKRWVFFAAVDDRVVAGDGDLLRPREHGELIIHQVENLIKDGWAFFSTTRDRTEYVLPSQAAVRIFFGHFTSWNKYVDYIGVTGRSRVAVHTGKTQCGS